jgi:hypothetical protein
MTSFENLVIGKTYRMPPIKYPNEWRDGNGNPWYPTTEGWREHMERMVERVAQLDGQMFKVIGKWGILKQGWEVEINGRRQYIYPHMFAPGTDFKRPIEDLKEDSRNVRNARLVGLPYGPDAVVASYLSGIDKKNAPQQNDLLREQAGVPFVAPDRKKWMSGRKTRRRRKHRKTYRQSRR